MKLYISADMEGTAGVCSWKQCDPSDTHEYPVYRRYMSQEVRAAIDGAREAGAEMVTVNDSHWDMRNLLFDELPGDDDLRVISGARKPLSMGQGLDAGFDAAFFTGYHAAAGEAATLAHTYSSDVYRVSVNGIACSEALLHAALCWKLRRTRSCWSPATMRSCARRSLASVGRRRRREAKHRLYSGRFVDAAGGAGGDSSRRSRRSRARSRRRSPLLSNRPTS